MNQTVRKLIFKIVQHMRLVFAAAICKPTTNGCSGNSVVLKTVVPLVRMRIE